MSDIHREVSNAMVMARVAAFALEPLRSGLTVDELRTIVVQAGYSVPLFNEVCETRYRVRGRIDQRVEGAYPVQLDPHDLLIIRTKYGFPPQIPYAEADDVAQAFQSLNREIGLKAPKTIEMLARGTLSNRDVERGLGFLLQIQAAQHVPGGYTCHDYPRDSYVRVASAGSEIERELETVMDRVRVIFGARSGTAVPSTPPIERFHLFLKKQGLEALAGWWGLTTQELRSLGDRHPTAATVLAASMLEAALVAIAEPALKSSQWNREFLKRESKDWKLGALIDQAEAAGTFSNTDAALAKAVADMRNRIHVGRYAEAGPQRFRPPFTNAQEALIALTHLELLLTKILDWPTVAALC